MTHREREREREAKTKRSWGGAIARGGVGIWEIVFKGDSQSHGDFELKDQRE